MSSDSSLYFASTARGLEEVLERELVELGARDVVQGHGGVFFKGSLRDCYRANMYLRTANRILKQVSSFPCPDADTLYREARKLPWHRFLSTRTTFAVDAFTRDTDSLRNAQYAALKLKDAACDALRSSKGSRPNIDRRNPDVPVSLFVAGGQAVVSLDTSGDRLHKRGYRADAKEAPLKETLAAGLVLLSGWDRVSPFVDPMCGSGTIVIEAALIALDKAPGLLGRSYAFQRWKDFRKEVWDDVVREARARCGKSTAAGILGTDLDKSALRGAADNAGRAGVRDVVKFQRWDVLDFAPAEERGTVVTNPPYGLRMELNEESHPFYKRLGDVLKHRCKGWTVEIFTGDKDLAKHIGLRTSRRKILYNGPLECRLLRYEMY